MDHGCAELAAQKSGLQCSAHFKMNQAISTEQSKFAPSCQLGIKLHFSPYAIHLFNVIIGQASITNYMNIPLSAPTPATPTIEAVHRDIALANNYRMELIKTLLAIAAALFAFTVTFGPALKIIAWKPAMWLGWTGLAISMIGGMVHLLGWDHFYKSYVDVEWRRRQESDQEAVKKDGKAARRTINAWRRLGMVMQFGGFVFGVAGVGLFAGANIENAAAKGDPAPTNVLCQSCPKPSDVNGGTSAGSAVPATNLKANP